MSGVDKGRAVAAIALTAILFVLIGVMALYPVLMLAALIVVALGGIAYLIYEALP